MKDKIREICYDLEIGCIDWTEASELLFALCDVGSSLPFENSESKLCKTCNGNGVMWFNKE